MVVFATPDFGAGAWAWMVLASALLLMVCAAGLTTLLLTWSICAERNAKLGWYTAGVGAGLGNVLLGWVLFLTVDRSILLLVIPGVCLPAAALADGLFHYLVPCVPDWALRVRADQDSILSGRGSDETRVARKDGFIDVGNTREEAQTTVCRQFDIREGASRQKEGR
jgi:hypothetical protein